MPWWYNVGIMRNKGISLALGLAVVMVPTLTSAPASAEDTIYSTQMEGDFDTAKEMLRRELDAEGFFVVKDLNIGRSLAHFAGKWGDNYNRNNFSQIHSLIICHAWFANQTLNISPPHMSLCPLSLALLHKDGTTMIHYALRQPMAEPADISEMMHRLDKRFVQALDQAVSRIREEMAQPSAANEN